MSQTDMDAMMYKIEGEDLYLIGTSEHSMIGKFIDQIIPEDKQHSSWRTGISMERNSSTLYRHIFSYQSMEEGGGRRLSAPHPEQHRGRPAPDAHRPAGEQPPGRRVGEGAPGAPPRSSMPWEPFSLRKQGE